MTTDAERERINPDQPETWPDCACGAPGSYLVRVLKPRWENLRGEAQIGDYSGRGLTRFHRYYTACDGCKVVGEMVDMIVGMAHEVPTFREEADDG